MLAEWTCSELSIQRTEARVYLDENAELLYVFKVGSISAYSLPLTARGGMAFLTCLRSAFYGMSSSWTTSVYVTHPGQARR